VIQCAVYWVRCNHHSYMFSEGYIGVSKDANKRWKYGHFWAQKNNRHENAKFSNAINKHGWNNLVKEVLVIGSEEYCYEIEKKLRFKEKIGWNLAIGGGKPPKSKPRGVDYVSPLKGVARPTPWLVGLQKKMPENFFSLGGKAGKGRKQTPEQIAKRVAARRATLEAQGRTR
jgi:hypothetical protein